MSQRSDSVRCAIVGCGRFGQYLLALIRDHVSELEIAAAVTHPLDDLDKIKSLLGPDVPIHRSIDELLAHRAGEVDAVILTSANHEHRDQAIAAARAGKHVFCEKPMSLSVQDGLAMVRSAKENNIKLMVGHKRRLRLTWRKMLEVCHAGHLGTIVAANINGWHTHDDIPAWWLDPATGGGLLHRAGCHDIDFLHALLGPSRWVQAVALSNARGSDARFSETMWISIGYASGAVAGMQVSLWYKPTHFRDSFDVQVLGTRGSALLKRHANPPQELFVYAQDQPVQRFAFDDDATEAYITELTSFARWVRQGETPVLSWREGLACVQVMQAAYESARRGGQRIELEELDP